MIVIVSYMLNCFATIKQLIGCRNGNASLRSKIEHDLETNAFLQQLYREAEVLFLTVV